MVEKVANDRRGDDFHEMLEADREAGGQKSKPARFRRKRKPKVRV